MLGPRGVVWNDGCAYSCLNGYYRSADGCLPCSVPFACVPGSFAVQCLPNSDFHCAECMGGPGLIWTSGCDSVCASGFYRSSDQLCSPCTSITTCTPGYQFVQCSASADASCVPCPNAGIPGVSFTSDCLFECESGYFRNGSVCAVCTGVVDCQPGFFKSTCGGFSDATCVHCVPPSGLFSWVSGCDFNCSVGYVRANNSACVEAPRVFTVVEATIAMQNSVNQICVDLDALLQAMSVTLNLVSNVRFVTNVTSLDGQACMENNLCPQCQNNSRRLLSSVAVVTSSRSVTPSVSTVVIPTPTKLGTVFQSALANTSAKLQPGVLVANVSTVPAPVAVIVVVEESTPPVIWEVHFELVLIGVVLTISVVVLVFIVMSRRPRMIHRPMNALRVSIDIGHKRKKAKD